MELVLEKALDGSLRPATEEDAEKLTRIKVGAGVKVKLTQTRNYAFLKKTMVLFGVAFDYFVEHGISAMSYRGLAVAPSKERFRKDLTILAGHYTATYDIRGAVRLEAKSLSFANCTEEEANAIYQSVITAALDNVYRGSLTERELQDWVDKLLRFA